MKYSPYPECIIKGEPDTKGSVYFYPVCTKKKKISTISNDVYNVLLRKTTTKGYCNLEHEIHFC